ncbi:hypothetical protein Tco_1261796 [Tanacetum coccineum]
MGYLVHACYGISPTRYYKDDSCWNVDLKSKATEDIINIRSFMEVFVLNHYVLVRKILIHKDGDGDSLFQLKSNSLPHAHAQTTKKHRDLRIMKAQELKTKTSAQTLIYKIFLQRYQVYQGRLLASFQDDAKYEHVGQDTRSQGGKDDQDRRIKI